MRKEDVTICLDVVYLLIYKALQTDGGEMNSKIVIAGVICLAIGFGGGYYFGGNTVVDLNPTAQVVPQAEVALQTEVPPRSTPEQMGGMRIEGPGFEQPDSVGMTSRSKPSGKGDAFGSGDAAVIVKMLPAKDSPDGIIRAQGDDSAPSVVLSAEQRLTEGTEVHVVSGYSSRAQIEVVVDRPGKDVLVVLSAYDSVPWFVRKKNAKSVAVLVGGGRQQYVSADDGIRVYTLENRRALRRADSIQDVSFATMLRLFKDRFGIDRIQSFTPLPGKMGKAQISIVGVSSAPQLSLAWPFVEQKLDKPLFMMPGGAEDVQWSPSGPVGDAAPLVRFGKQNRLALPDGSVVTRDDHGIKLTDKKGAAVDYPLPANFPRFSWAEGMAYAPEKRLLGICSNGGEGFFYRFDVGKRSWVDARSQNEMDLGRLAYDPSTEGFVAVSTMQPLIVELSGEGQLLQQYRIDNRLLPGVIRLAGLGHGSDSGLVVIPLKEYLIVVKAQGARRSMMHMRKGSTGLPVEAVWVVDRKTRRGKLTYKGS